MPRMQEQTRLCGMGQGAGINVFLSGKHILMNTKKGYKYPASVIALATSTLATILILLLLIPWVCDEFKSFNMDMSDYLSFFYTISQFTRNNMVLVLPLSIIALIIGVVLGQLSNNKAVFVKIFNTISLILFMFVIFAFISMAMEFMPLKQ